MQGDRPFESTERENYFDIALQMCKTAIDKLVEAETLQAHRNTSGTLDSLLRLQAIIDSALGRKPTRPELKRIVLSAHPFTNQKNPRIEQQDAFALQTLLLRISALDYCQAALELGKPTIVLPTYAIMVPEGELAPAASAVCQVMGHVDRFEATTAYAIADALKTKTESDWDKFGTVYKDQSSKTKLVPARDILEQALETYDNARINGPGL